MASEAKRSKKDFDQILIEQLKCQICENGVRAGKHRWYSCSKAHKICQDCKEVKEKKKCSCNKIIANEFCPMTEALLSAEKMRFRSENHSRGCQVILNEENMIAHEAVCNFRMVKCPHFTCTDKVSFHVLNDHIKANHPWKMREGTNFTLDQLTKASVAIPHNPRFKSDIVFILVKDAGTFIIQAKVQNDVFYHWIQFVGSPLEAKNFYYTIEYKNEEKTPPTHCLYTGQMTSIDETADSIIENGNCIVISRKQMLNRFDSGDGGCHYYFKIKSLKEEAKNDVKVEPRVSEDRKVPPLRVRYCM